MYFNPNEVYLGESDWYLDEVKSHLRVEYKEVNFGVITMYLPDGTEAPDEMTLGEYLRIWKPYQ